MFYQQGNRQSFVLGWHITAWRRSCVFKSATAWECWRTFRNVVAIYGETRDGDIIMSTIVPPPCWRYATLQLFYLLNLHIPESCSVWNYTRWNTWSINKLGITWFRHLIHSLLTSSKHIPQTWRPGFILSEMSLCLCLRMRKLVNDNYDDGTV